jgi:hypothetical protein
MSDDFDLGHLFDGDDLSALGGGHLYDGDAVDKQKPDDLLHRDVIVFEGMMPWVTCHGSTTVPKYFAADGSLADPRLVSDAFRSGNPGEALAAYTADVHTVYCCVVGRTQKNSVMSENWAQDTTPDKHGGNREMNQVKVLAPEWHGDFCSRFWFNGSCYEVDGSPVYLPHSSDMAKHYEFPARRVYAAELAHNKVSPPVPPEGAEIWGM